MFRLGNFANLKCFVENLINSSGCIRRDNVEIIRQETVAINHKNTTASFGNRICDFEWREFFWQERQKIARDDVVGVFFLAIR